MTGKDLMTGMGHVSNRFVEETIHGGKKHKSRGLRLGIVEGMAAAMMLVFSLWMATIWKGKNPDHAVSPSEEQSFIEQVAILSDDSYQIKEFSWFTSMDEVWNSKKDGGMWRRQDQILTRRDIEWNGGFLNGGYNFENNQLCSVFYNNFYFTKEETILCYEEWMNEILEKCPKMLTTVTNPEDEKYEGVLWRAKDGSYILLYVNIEDCYVQLKIAAPEASPYLLYHIQR